MRTSIVFSWILIGTVIFILTGCSANVQAPGCEPTTFVNPSGVERQIMPAYLETYGCGTFEGMDAEAFSSFCAMEFPESEGSWAGDIEIGCDARVETCERYWHCE